jgi:hypothetical protein
MSSKREAVRKHETKTMTTNTGDFAFPTDIGSASAVMTAAGIKALSERALVRRHLTGRYTVYRVSNEELLFQEFDLSLELEGEIPYYGWKNDGAKEEDYELPAIDGEQLNEGILLIVGSEVTSGRDILKLLLTLVTDVVKHGLFWKYSKSGHIHFCDID